MTEPAVASSDATNISSSIVADGDDYVINGEKWWTSGYGRPDCSFMIFMGVSNPDAPKHQRQSMIIVPKDTLGINLERWLTVYGSDHAPSGHAHLTFKDVRVPKENMILGEGRGWDHSLAPVSMFTAVKPSAEVTRKVDLSRKSRVRGGDGEIEGYTESYLFF